MQTAINFLADNWVSILAILGWIVAATPTKADDAVFDRVKNVATVLVPLLRRTPPPDGK